ncbi:hypothetical protein NPS53_08090 [Pseudomonas putida]|uniref:hypothetical protein n=1 Tax=Pseudomonas putida TaxID=303 RepID=UPI002363F844|nr:hypothetical protein [Pseudomonas putida]MDD2139530.1 hypothetical protein [Pseudomonas putida]HDS1721453.1 hypothetical protein [Pseudomonas putida]
MLFKKATLAALIGSTLLVSGCVTHLSPGQEREMAAYEAKGFAQTEKSPGLAATLGIFPIAGYAYTGHPVAASFNLLTWPFFGFVWGPWDNWLAAEERNYFATQEYVTKSKRQELAVIDEKLEQKKLTYEQHLREQREIENKYSPY